ETHEQFLFLKENNCHEIQGYYFSKPVSVDAIQADIYKNQSGQCKTSSRTKTVLTGGVLG
ncbi:MAG: hypothetical protein CVV01_05905, partial [Firmicutes bacterium HGW-Firmicutes-6]